MSQRSVDIIAKIIKWGLFILPVTALIVSGEFIGNARGDLGNMVAAILMPGVGDMFFPFITGKNFFFRIVVEVLFALWILAASFDKKLRPRFSPILWALIATLAVLILATIFGVNPYRSFWSNYERMEGLFGHIHLFLYFLVAVSVLRTEKDWKWLFHASLYVSIFIALYSVWQLLGRLDIHQGGTRIDATLGNATYLAVYLLFHLFLLIYYFLQTRNIGWRIFYGSLFAVHTFLLYHTATRGAILGFLGGLLLFGLLYGFLSKEKKYKLAAASLAGGVLMLVLGFYLARGTAFIKNSPVLSRFSGISLSETTTESRFILVRMGWQAFLERPVLGWGPENFNIVFSKFYNPRLWRQEPWFDRAHNVFLDWLVSGGVLGLLAYLSIFGSAVYLLWRAWKAGKAGTLETSLFTALLAGYFFQNIFVFDQLISYLLFFSVLGFLHFKTLPALELKPVRVQASPLNFVIPIFGFIAVIFSLYFLNAKPLMASRTLLNSIKIASTDSKMVDETLSEFDRAFSFNTFGTMEGREQLANFAGKTVSADVSQELKLKAFQKAVSEMEKQIAENPLDPRAHLFLATLYQSGGQNDKAIEVLNKAAELSPTRPHILFVLADAHLRKGDTAKAFELVERAYNLDQTYGEAIRNLAVVAALAGKIEYSDALLKKHFGSNIVADQQLVNVYSRLGMYDRVRDLWIKIIEGDQNNAQNHVSLAATYAQLGDRPNAILSLQKAMLINPEFKTQGEKIIEELKAGRNP